MTKVNSSDYQWLSEFKWYLSTNGYVYATLNGRPIAMHVLIMKTPKGMHTDHINHDKLDNRRENLRVVSPRENILHRRSFMGSENPFYGKTHSDEYKNVVSLKFSKPVLQFALDGELINRYKSILSAEKETGISNGNISSVCNGFRKTAGGYKWKHERDR